MAEPVINIIAVFAAAAINMVLGALWYSPILFGNQWLALMGWTKKDIEKRKKDMGIKYGLTALGGLVMAYVLAHIVDYADAVTPIDGMMAGFWVWLGFIATTHLGMILWEGKPFKLYALNAGYYFVSLVIMGALLVALP